MSRSDAPSPHHFTVDVEEYFHCSALEPHVARSRWDSMESRVEEGVDRILAVLDEAGTLGTFFVLGWVAERHPGLVRRIADEGHEIASHGWGHRRVCELEPEEFRRSVRRAKDLLEDLTGAPVRGYRAPTFSIVPGREWALDVLIQEGHAYDSSLYPVRRGEYGYPGAPRDPHTILRPAGTIAEFPPATLRLGGFPVPAGGGAYFRVLPYPLVRGGLRSASRRGGMGTFYIHPWEVDPGQPRLDLPLLTRARQYLGLEGTLGRLRRLLEDFDFQPIVRTLRTRDLPVHSLGREGTFLPSAGQAVPAPVPAYGPGAGAGGWLDVAAGAGD